MLRISRVPVGMRLSRQREALLPSCLLATRLGRKLHAPNGTCSNICRPIFPAHCPRLQSGDRVWLIGEQRWEDRSRVKRGGQ